MDDSGDSIKAIFVGPSNAGKTSLITTFLLGTFAPEHKPTLFENYYKDIKCNHIGYRIYICDTGGHSDFNRLQKMAYLSADVLVLCISYDKRDGLEEAERWMADLKTARIPVILCLTRADLGRCIPMEQIERFSKKYRIEGLFECSANDRKSLRHLFKGIVQVYVDGVTTKSGYCTYPCHIC